VLLKAKERTEKEFKEIFAAAGFSITRIIPLPPTPYNVIEGVKI
jgi:hypothetical protein